MGHLIEVEHFFVAVNPNRVDVFSWLAAISEGVRNGSEVNCRLGVSVYAIRRGLSWLVVSL